MNADMHSEMSRVVILTDHYRVTGRVRVAPDGSVWDLKHRQAEGFVTIYEVKFNLLKDGKRVYEGKSVELSHETIIALFKEEDLLNMRYMEE